MKKKSQDEALQPTEPEIRECKHPDDVRLDSSSQADSGLEIEVTLLKQQLKSAQDRYDELMRKYAAMQDSLNRANREHHRHMQYAIQPLLETLIPVLDGLEQASIVENATIESMKEGLRMTFQNLEKIYHQFGVTVINPLGEIFDSQYHEAVTLLQTSEHPHHAVIQVLQKGWVLHGRLIRPARVVVATSVH